MHGALDVSSWTVTGLPLMTIVAVVVAGRVGALVAGRRGPRGAALPSAG